MMIALTAQGATLQAARATLNGPLPGGASFTSVSFRQSYPTPPLVFVLADDVNPAPSTLRISNITTTGFQAQVFEPQGEDGTTVAESFSYVAILPGVYTLPGGTVVEAGQISMTNHQGRNVPGASWQTLNFASTFATAPAVLVNIQTNNNGTLTPGSVANPWLTTAVRSVTPASLQLALERSETDNGTTTTAESVGYLAIASGSVDIFLDNAAGMWVYARSVPRTRSPGGTMDAQRSILARRLLRPLR